MMSIRCGRCKKKTPITYLLRLYRLKAVLATILCPECVKKLKKFLKRADNN